MVTVRELSARGNVTVNIRFERQSPLRVDACAPHRLRLLFASAATAAALARGCSVFGESGLFWFHQNIERTAVAAVCRAKMTLKEQGHCFTFWINSLEMSS